MSLLLLQSEPTSTGIAMAFFNRAKLVLLFLLLLQQKQIGKRNHELRELSPTMIEPEGKSLNRYGLGAVKGILRCITTKCNHMTDGPPGVVVIQVVYVHSCTIDQEELAV